MMFDHLLAEGFQRAGAVVQQALLFQHRLINRRQLFRHHLMFTRQRDLSGNPLLKFKQTVRIEIQTVMVVAQLVAGLAELNGRLFQHIQDAGKLAVHAHQLADQLLRGIKLALQIGLFAVRQYRKGVLAGAEQLAAVGQALVLFVNLLEFSRQRVKFVQLFKLILQQIGAGGALLALLLMLGQLAAALVPLAIVLGHTLSKRILTGIAVEQRFLVFGFGQQLVGMLAVDLDQQLAQLAQLRERDGGAVDEAARAAVGADHPAK